MGVEVIKSSLKGRMGRGWKAAFLEGAEDAAEHTALFWWGRYLPGHFEAGAAIKYGMAPRLKEYMIKKAKRGHQKPLVWSGTFRDLMLQQSPQVAYRNGEVVAKFSGMPRYVYYVDQKIRDRKGKVVGIGKRQPDKRAEVTRTTGKEEAELGRQYERRLMRVLGENAA